jgi:hypothetical protein
VNIFFVASCDENDERRSEDILDERAKASIRMVHSLSWVQARSKAVAEINITEINTLKKANPNRTASE